MPELPEVEHVVRALAGAITGRRIVAADLRLKRLAPGTSRTVFNRKLKGARFEAVSRRGKYILLQLDSAVVLLVHLRMTGKFVCLTADQELPPYAHAIFYLDDARRLVFCDMRQFGRMKIVATSRLAKTREISQLAPEPLLDEFTPAYLRQTLLRSRRSLKTLLLDQTRVLGLGNIYAAEALFRARINPFKVASKLSSRRVERLHQAIRDVLRAAVSGNSSRRLNLENPGGFSYGE